jgi:hypothetical protein
MRRKWEVGDAMIRGSRVILVKGRASWLKELHFMSESCNRASLSPIRSKRYDAV